MFFFLLQRISNIFFQTKNEEENDDLHRRGRETGEGAMGGERRSLLLPNYQPPSSPRLLLLLGQKPTTRIKIFSAAPYSLDISMHTTTLASSS